MQVNVKQFTYTRQADSALDLAFECAAVYGRVKLARDHLFWKNGLRWYTIPLDRIQRIYRRVEFVYGKLCLGGSSYDIQRLMLVLKDGTNLEIPVGDRMQKTAAELVTDLEKAHPEIEYGKD